MNALRALATRLYHTVTRYPVALMDAPRTIQMVQVCLLADETHSVLEYLEPYGFTSHLLPGAEGLAVFIGGDRSHGVVICAADRRYRPTDLQAGEVSIYTHEGAHHA